MLEEDKDFITSPYLICNPFKTKRKHDLFFFYVFAIKHARLGLFDGLSSERSNEIKEMNDMKKMQEIN